MCTLMLSFASCGRQHNAESVVKDFMETNMKNYADVNSLDFNDIDSTRYLNDSIITAMRANTKATATQYKSAVSYGKSAVGKTLITARVDYKVGEKPYTDTYYLTPDLTEVVAFKSTEK